MNIYKINLINNKIWVIFTVICHSLVEWYETHPSGSKFLVICTELLAKQTRFHQISKTNIFVIIRFPNVSVWAP